MLVENSRKWICVACNILLFLVVANAQQKESWFPFTPTENGDSSRINMRHWIHKPAGKYGFVQMKND
ncbi:MAG TPA: hypothetical protein VD905_22205, partial [Flavobacteriales bacterium]|nr:hypothetical protein [Flavobacteriales bacterium]